MQTIILAFTFLATLYTIRQQSKEIARNQELSAAATLFEYYNAKISSLRQSIMRDTNDRNIAQLDALEDREVDLREFLQKHEKVRERLERLYGELAE